MKDLESYISEAIKNIRSDRAITTTLLMELMEYMKKDDDRKEETVDTTRGSSRRERARTCASGTKRGSLRLAAEDEIDSSPQRGSEDVYEKVFEKGTPRNNQPNAFDVQPTQRSASSQFRFSARRVDVDKVDRIVNPVGRHRRTHQMCTHVVFRVSSHIGVFRCLMTNGL